MTLWIGLTGGIGSGKSQAADCFREWGVPVIDADAVNRELINQPESSAIPLIKQKFGAQYLNESGSLNRDLMRDLIFRQPEAKTVLEQILHPLILKQIVQWQMQHENAHYGVIELPLLRSQSRFLSIIQRVLLIHCDERVRISRVMERNGFSEQQVRNIIAQQPSDEARFELADDVIHNSGSLNDLRQAVWQQHLVYQQFTL